MLKTKFNPKKKYFETSSNENISLTKIILSKSSINNIDVLTAGRTRKLFFSVYTYVPGTKLTRESALACAQVLHLQNHSSMCAPPFPYYTLAQFSHDIDPFFPAIQLGDVYMLLYARQLLNSHGVGEVMLKTKKYTKLNDYIPRRGY